MNDMTSSATVKASRTDFLKKLGGLVAIGAGIGAFEHVPVARAAAPPSGGGGGKIFLDSKTLVGAGGGAMPDSLQFHCCQTMACYVFCNQYPNLPYGYNCVSSQCSGCECYSSWQGNCFYKIEPGC